MGRISRHRNRLHHTLPSVSNRRRSVTIRPVRNPKKPSKKANRYHLPVLVEPDEDGVFIVSVPTLRGCRTYGLALEEATKNISEAAALCLQDEATRSAATFIGVRDLEIVA